MSCKRLKGGSALGLVIFIFYSLLFIMFPVHLAIQENNAFRALNNRVKVATEMACFSLVRHLNAESMSQGMLVEISDQKERFLDTVVFSLGDEFDIVNLTVQLDNQSRYKVIQVFFEYPYKTKFILKGLMTKMVKVHLSYELPLDN